MMNYRGLGPLEEAVLWTIVRLGSRAYGVAIRREVNERLGRNIAVGAIYTCLSRLEEKGFVSSVMGEPTPERGGRRKKYYRIEAPGQRALNEARSRATALYGSGLQPSGA